jgi:hypothetical protein
MCTVVPCSLFRGAYVQSRQQSHSDGGNRCEIPGIASVEKLDKNDHKMKYATIVIAMKMSY